MLPAGGTLAERMATRKQRTEVPVERLQPLIPELFAELRRRTRERFPLPAEEGVELEWVNDQPWSAYNWYRGNRRSLIEINTDKPQQITDLVMLLAHEAYPGHHTEHACKETRLVRDEGRIEHCIALLNSPACTIAEGIATMAESIILSDEEWIRWHADVIFPRAGCDHLDAERELAINKATDILSDAGGNAAFMLHDQGVSPDEVTRYLERWKLASPEDARRGVRFISMPVARSYTFTYTEGKALLEALFVSPRRPRPLVRAFADRSRHTGACPRVERRPLTPTMRAGAEASSQPRTPGRCFGSGLPMTHGSARCFLFVRGPWSVVRGPPYHTASWCPSTPTASAISIPPGSVPLNVPNGWRYDERASK